MLENLRWMGWFVLIGLGMALPWGGHITQKHLRFFLLASCFSSAIYFAVFAMYVRQPWPLEWSVLLGSMTYIFTAMMLRNYRLGLSVQQMRQFSAWAMVIMMAWAWFCFHSTPDMNTASSFWLGQLMLGWVFWEYRAYAKVWPSWSAKAMTALVGLQLVDNFFRTLMVMNGWDDWALLFHWMLLLIGLMVLVLFFDVLHQRKTEHEQHLVNSLAHELRQPLGAMRLKLEHLIHEAPAMPAQEAHELLHQLISENDRATAIIQGLRRFFDLSQMQRHSLDLSGMLEGMMARLAPDLRARGIALEVELESNVTVFADAAQLDMVLFNLMSNACEALDAQEDQSERLIRVALKSRQQLAFITIADNGPGVPPENRSRIFEIHFSSKAKGMGLGLWLSRQVMKDHGGQLALRASDRGAEFVLSMPLFRSVPSQAGRWKGRGRPDSSMGARLKD